MDNCNILGVNIVVTNMDEIVDYVEENIKLLTGKYICVSNVHTTIMAYNDEFYKKVQNNSAFSLPDGKPLSLVQKFDGFSNAKRVTGPDFMETIFEVSQRKGYRHFFYGSTEETLYAMREKLIINYPKLDIVGMYSPPFKEFLSNEDREILELIDNSNVDFLWIALGAPKQERWMFSNRGNINAIMIGVGAAFDFYAGIKKRAPLWMQRCCLEWLYRLVQEPRRLFKRYLVTNIQFIYLILIRQLKVLFINKKEVK